MIGWFPRLYPDELLYSGLARYGDWMAYSTRSALCQDLFGVSSVHAMFDLPHRLDGLISELPPGHHYPADMLMDHHTLLPFYLPFLSAERADRVRYAMCSNNRNGIYAVVGRLPASHPAFQTLHFCPVCADEDRQRYDETYWHRVHHAPGVEVCPVHQVWLENTYVYAGSCGDQPVFLSAERTILPTSPRPLDLSDATQRALLAIAENVAWLLSQTELEPQTYDFRARYLARLGERDLCSADGQVRESQLLEAIQNAYSKDLLYLLCCPVNPYLPSPWPIRLVQKRGRRLHPLHHILMVHFLGYTFATFST
jgi:hypothetical protein